MASTDDFLPADRHAGTGRDETIPVVEERATVGVEWRESGGVRVALTTEHVNENHAVDLSSETVEVTRHAVGHEVETMPQPREEGDLLIIPVVEERAVVVTRLFLTEEIHIRRTRATETVEVPVTLRRQHAVVEQLDSHQPLDPAGEPGLAPDSPR